jgi:hypothetical protein
LKTDFQNENIESAFKIQLNSLEVRKMIEINVGGWNEIKKNCSHALDDHW